MPEVSSPDKRCLVGVTLDENSLGRGTPDQEHERAVAIYDLIERNSFTVLDHDGGPYLAPVVTHHLSLSPFRRIIKDYELICESYYAAIRTATPAQIEAIDMGRRGLHDEAAGILADRLASKVAIDFDTARRLFTLIYALHWKG
jgi:uncharacterized protein (UPF0262 family)